VFIYTPRKTVKLETPFAFGKRDLSFIAKVLAKTPLILARRRPKAILPATPWCDKARSSWHRGSNVGFYTISPS
jgi:hypothetical protein